MCGISGYYGYKAPLKAVMITLGQLERGTLGSGVAYTCNSKIKILKAPTHPANFITRNLRRLRANSRMAIAHNRLPSIGKVAYENTHPFLACDGSFALVHNGHALITNYRKQLKQHGHKIMGETDSEVICHLIEELRDQLGDLVTALEMLESYGFSGAIALLTRKHEIYALRSHHYPLVIAEAENAYALASTKLALKLAIGEPKNTFQPKPYQIIRINHKGIKTITEGKPETPKNHNNLNKLLNYYYPL